MLDELVVEVPGRELALEARAATTGEAAAWPSRAIAAIILLTSAIAALGLLGLTSRPLTVDGAATRLFATTPGFAGLSEDGGNMALYYLLMHGLVERFGASRFVLRLPSIICGAATVPVVAELGRRARNVSVGLLSALLFAVSLPFVSSEQAARGYALGTLLVSAGVLSWLSLVRRPGFVRASLYVMLTTLASWTLLLNWWVVLGEVLVWVWSWAACRDGGKPAFGRSAWRWTGSGLAAAVLCTLPLAAIARQLGFQGLVGARNRVSPSRIVHTVLVLTSGENGEGLGHWEVVGVLLGLATAALWVTAIWSSSHGQRRPEPLGERRLAVRLLAAWLLVPPLGQVVVSLLLHPMYQYRYFILCLPAAAILTAIGLERLRRFGVIMYAACASVLVAAHAAFLVQLHHP